MSYTFKPMMPFYGRFVAADTAWLMSREGRRLIAKTIRFCRARYGRGQAKEFHNALMWVGCLYPLSRS